MLLVKSYTRMLEQNVCIPHLHSSTNDPNAFLALPDNVRALGMKFSGFKTPDNSTSGCRGVRLVWHLGLR